jgi:hypothetical protein
MENTTAATKLSQIFGPPQSVAVSLLRRCSNLLVAGLKGIGAAWCDPRTCNAFWIGGVPEMWEERK